MKQMLTIKEAAEYLGVSQQTVRTLIKNGYLTAVRIGPKIIRINAAELASIGDEL
jgi:excisionase family DNA binding protein